MDTITNQGSEKIKDPRRVASGKRLAAISKDAKARKAHEMQQTSHNDKRSSFNFGYVVGVIGVITGVGALYFAYRQDKSQDVSPPPPSSPQHTTTPSQPTTCSNTEYFD